jgi:hypothetical protein
MRTDGKVEEKEVVVGKGATKGTGSRQGKEFPGVSSSRALGAIKEDILRECTIQDAVEGGGEAKAMAADLEGQSVLICRKTCILKREREVRGCEAALNVMPIY